MDTMTSVQELAEEAYKCFEVASRPDDSDFIRIKGGSPEWVTELVHKAHGDDFLPDDYRYRWAMEACERIAEASETDLDDLASEFADSAVDVYTGRRFAWLGSNLQRQYYVDEAVEEFDHGVPFSVADCIGMGQYAEAREVYELTLSALQDLAA